MSGKHVIERVKENAGYRSDNAMATVLEIDRRIISNIKRTGGDPSAKLLVQFMKAGNLSIEETERLLDEKGFADVSLVIVTALSALPLAYAVHVLKNCILC